MSIVVQTIVTFGDFFPRNEKYLRVIKFWSNITLLFLIYILQTWGCGSGHGKSGNILNRFWSYRFVGNSRWVLPMTTNDYHDRSLPWATDECYIHCWFGQHLKRTSRFKINIWILRWIMCNVVIPADQWIYDSNDKKGPS